MFARNYINSRRFHKLVCSFISNQPHSRQTRLISTHIALNGPDISLDTSRQSPTKPGKTQYKLIEYVEDLERYCPGGYHPLTIGDALNHGRYQLVDKLGYGGYSTIWLARDLHRAKYVAVKVITAEASSCSSEASFIQSLGDSLSRPGSEIILALPHRQILGCRSQWDTQMHCHAARADEPV